MISFDDNGGSGGSIDLSPIYKTIQVLNVNTESIWNYVSTLSGGTGTITLSTPYLETYRSQDENYMYNITGGLTDINYAGYKIIRGYMNTVSNKSLYATKLDIDYVSDLWSCTFDGGTWNNAVSLRGKWFCYNDFHSNGEVSIKGNILAHNLFSEVGTVSINALNLHTILSDSANSFFTITCLNITCDTINKPYINASELNLKGREMYDGRILGGMYHNITIGTMTNNEFSQIEDMNITGKTINSCTFNYFDYCNLNCHQMDYNRIISINDLNMTCHNVSNMTLADITDLDFNVQAINSLYISNNSMVRLNFYNANSISISALTGTYDLLLNGGTLEEMTVANSNVNIHGSIKSIDRITLSGGSIDLTVDNLEYCDLTSVRGFISAKTVNVCAFSSCSNLTVYADYFMGDVKNCQKVRFYCDTVHDCVFESDTSVFFSFNHLTYENPKMSYVSDLTFYCDLEKYTYYTTTRYFDLLQGSNWLGKLYLKSNITSAQSYLTKLASVGIYITQTMDLFNCPVVFDYISGTHGND